MYTGTYQKKIRCATVARRVIELAGLDVDSALVAIETVSEEQKNLAGDVRLHAIAQIWSEDIDFDYQTSQMAQAIIAVVNRHPQTHFWLDNKNATFAGLLEDEIEKEMA